MTGGKISSAFPCPYLSIWLWHWVPIFTELWCHPHPRVFYARRGLGAARKEALCVGPEWDQASVKQGLWCSTGVSALSQRSLTSEFCSGPPFPFVQRHCGSPGNWLQMLSCLSAAIFYFIDLFSVLIRWGIPNLTFSNVLPQQIGCLELNSDTFWDTGAHEPPLSSVSDLYISLSEQVYRLCDFFILSGFSSNSDCWLLWWGLKTHFFYSSFSHSWTATGQEVLWFSRE